MNKCLLPASCPVFRLLHQFREILWELRIIPSALNGLVSSTHLGPLAACLQVVYEQAEKHWAPGVPLGDIALHLRCENWPSNQSLIH